MDLYDEKIAEKYDTFAFLWKLYPQLIRKIIKQHNDNIDLLDLGSGTGSLIFELKNELNRATGIDISPSMIDLALQKKELLINSNINFINQDIASFNSSLKYNIVMSTDGVLPYLPFERINTLLSNLKNYIADNGKAVFEFWTGIINQKPKEFIQTIPKELCSYNENELGSNFLCQITEIDNSTKRYFFHYPEKNYSITIMKEGKRETIHKHYYVSKKNICSLIEQKGFRIHEILTVENTQGEYYWIPFYDEAKLLTIIFSL